MDAGILGIGEEISSSAANTMIDSQLTIYQYPRYAISGIGELGRTMPATIQSVMVTGNGKAQ